jgi:hypothetical protein
MQWPNTFREIMVTSAKASTQSVARPVVNAVAKRKSAASAQLPNAARATTAASAQPALRFYHSKALRDQTNTVLSALEARPSQSRHGEAVADLVAKLIEAGMDYYFLKALKQAEVGFVTEQSARLAISGAVGLVSSVSRKFIMRMDPPQLLGVAAHIRSLAAS